MKHIYEIQCGDVVGAIEARSPGAAFRSIMRRAKMNSSHWGELARFRLVRKSGQIMGSWHYQSPDALRKEP